MRCVTKTRTIQLELVFFGVGSCAIGAVAVILNALTCPATKSFLSTRLVLFIGHISFAVGCAMICCNPKLKHVHNDVNNAGLRPQLSITRYCHKIDCYMMNRRPPRPLPLDCLMQVYLLHYIVLVLFDHWMFGSRGVSTNRPEVVGSLLLLIIPLTLLIAYPFYMYVAMSAGRSNVTPGRLSLSFCSLPLATMRFFVYRDTAAYLILSQLHRRTVCQIGANFLRFCSPQNTSMHTSA